MSLRPGAALVVAILLISSASFADKPKVAVLGLEVETKGAGVDPASTRLAKELTDGLRQAARGPRGKYQLAPNSNRELIDEKLMKSCDSEQPACMAPIGTDVNADFLMFGRIDKDREGYQVTIKLLDVAKRTEARPWRQLIPMKAVRDDAVGWATKKYVEIVGDEAVKPPVVDDPPPAPLPDPPPPVKVASGTNWKRMAWASGAVAVLSGGAAAFSMYQLNYVVGYKDDPTTPNVDPKEVSNCAVGADGKVLSTEKFGCRHGGALYKTQFIAGGVAAAAVAFTGYAIYKSSRSGRERSSQAGRVAKRKFAVTPVVTPDGAGATVRFDW